MCPAIRLVYIQTGSHVCSCRHTLHTQQMGKWELLNHIIVTAIMTDDCIISERKSLSLFTCVFWGLSDYSLSLWLVSDILYWGQKATFYRLRKKMKPLSAQAHVCYRKQQRLKDKSIAWILQTGSALSLSVLLFFLPLNFIKPILISHRNSSKLGVFVFNSLLIVGHSLPNYLFTLVIWEEKSLLSLCNPINLRFMPIKHKHADILCRKQAALLNVLASVCDVLPADSFVHGRKQPGGCSYTMTVHRFFECLAWMLRGFRVVAQTLLLTVTSHLDHIRFLLTKEHPAIHMLLLLILSLNLMPWCISWMRSSWWL